MILGKNPYRFLSEAATADLLDPKVSDEVKEVIDELEDDLKNNIEEVDEKDMVSNGGVPVTTKESAVLVESLDGKTYYIAMEAVLAICEDEAMEEAPAGEEPAPEEIGAKAPDVIADIAEKNGVEPEQVTVIISAEESAAIMESMIFESKCTGKDGKAAKKAKEMGSAVKALQGKVKLFKNK